MRRSPWATAAVALLIFLFFKKLLPNKLVWMGLIASAVAGELVMAFGYIAYEALLYGWGAAIINLPALSRALKHHGTARREGQGEELI